MTIVFVVHIVAWRGTWRAHSDVQWECEARHSDAVAGLGWAGLGACRVKRNAPQETTCSRCVALTELPRPWLSSSSPRSHCQEQPLSVNLSTLLSQAHP
jgi:hypothetical protein